MSLSSTILLPATVTTLAEGYDYLKWLPTVLGAVLLVHLPKVHVKIFNKAT